MLEPITNKAITTNKLSFDGYVFKDASSSNHPHAYTSLGKIGSDLVAISGYKAARKVELYTNGSWLQQSSFPGAHCDYCDYFDSYSTVTYNNEVYIFGELLFLVFGRPFLP